MRLLLDTHVALWAIADSPRLPSRARALIEDSANDVYVSAASVWEVAIKHRVRRDPLPFSGSDVLGWFQAAGYRLVPVTGEHAAEVDRLPAIHADPFDRILVAQARVEPFRLVTHDEVLAAYGDAVLFV